MTVPDIGVLVVDDDFRVAEIHGAYVERVPGFRVLAQARSAAQARQSIVELAVDLILLDVYLPDDSGLALLRELRSSPYCPVDVIVVTAARDANSIAEAVHSGAISYLVKPFTFAVLRERLESYHRMRQELTRVIRLGETDQAGVDQVFAALRPAGGTTLPKSLAAETLNVLLEALREAQAPMGTGELAAAAGVSVATARRYLAHLLDTGQASMRLRYGSTGRPEHLYQLVRAS